MKKANLVLVMIISFLPLFSQTEEQVFPKTQKQIIKEAKKAEREEERKKTFELTKSMIEQRSFVLEANQLSGRSGMRINVNSSLNFVSIDSNYCVIQLGSNTGIGANGVGGVTAEGLISKYKITQGKKGDSFTVNIFTNTSLGAFDIVIFIFGEGNSQADVTQSTTGIVRRYYGRLVTHENSRVYKGRSI